MSRLAAAVILAFLALPGCAGWYAEQEAKNKADEEEERDHWREWRRQREEREEKNRRRQAMKYDVYCARRGFVLDHVQFGHVSRNIECRAPRSNQEHVRIDEILQEWEDLGGH